MPTLAKMDKYNDSSYALITGASSGIGKAFAFLMAEKGYNLILLALEEDLLIEVVSHLKTNYPIEIISYAIDFSDAKATETLFQEIITKQLDIEILINNAGFGILGDFANVPLKQHQAVMQVNMNTFIHLSYSILTQMLTKNRGKILNVASTASFQPGPGMAIYFATKAFILSFSRALAMEVKGTGISVTTLCPGPTQSGFAKTAGMTDNKIHKGIVPICSAEYVAMIGYKALMKKRDMVIVGWINKICSFMVMLLPKKIVMRSIMKLHRQN